MSARTITDEQLSAYLDQALPASEAAAVAAALQQDVALQRRWQALQQANAAVAAAYRAIDDAPMPDSIMTMLTPTPAPTAQPKQAMAGRPRLSAWLRNWQVGWVAPVAASLALLIGLGLGLRLAPTPIIGAPPPVLMAGRVDASNPIHQALQSVPSGEAAAFMSGQLIVTPVLSFVAADGGYCREFRFHASDQSSRAVACQEDGGWVVHMTVAENAVRDAGDAYLPASSSLRRQFDATVNAMIAEAPLDREAEAALLDRGWR
ncbi:MAG: hypothetical protein Tsb0016_20210 [Sphingomonadales bacterium]